MHTIETITNKIRDIETRIENFNASEYIDYSQYADMLDDVYGEIEICGYIYSAGVALKRIDPIAYDEGFRNYCDSIDLDDVQEYRELTEELEALCVELDELQSPDD